MRDARTMNVYKHWRSSIVIVFAAVLVVQGALSFAVNPEPYPVVRMPAFRAAPSVDGTTEMTFISAEVTYADGDTASVDPYDIMAPFRFSTARPSWDHVFGPNRDREPADDVVAWLRMRLKEMDGARDPKRIEMCWMKADVDVSDASVVDRQPCRLTVIAL